MENKIEQLSALVAELMQRVAVLERALGRTQRNGQHSYKDLYGCLKGKLNATDELLEECEFKLDWNKIDPAE